MKQLGARGQGEGKTVEKQTPRQMEIIMLRKEMPTGRPKAW